MKYYTDIQEIFKEFEAQDIIPTPQQLKDAFNDRNKQPEPELEFEKKDIPQSVIFEETFKQFIKECGTQNSWGNATYVKFAAVKNHLDDFDKKLSFETLTESKVMEYVNCLRTSLDMRNTTIEKHISYLKWFLRWSTKKGYNSNRDFEDDKALPVISNQKMNDYLKELAELAFIKLPICKCFRFVQGASIYI